MCRSMVGIQSATAEIKRRKKKKERQDENIMSVFDTQGGHKNLINLIKFNLKLNLNRLLT